LRQAQWEELVRVLTQLAFSFAGGYDLGELRRVFLTLAKSRGRSPFERVLSHDIVCGFR
jgi:hypothetical protein